MTQTEETGTQEANSGTIASELRKELEPVEQEDAKANPDKETEKETEEKTPSAKSQDDEGIEESLVTAELAEAMNLPKGLIGKPLSQVGESYRKATGEISDTHKRLKDLETNYAALEGQISQAQIKKTEQEANKEVTTEFGKAPDPVDDPDGFQLWLEKRDEIMLEKFQGILKEKLENDPNIKISKELAAERTEQGTILKLQNGLPKDVEASKVLDAWFEDNQEEYAEALQSGRYLNKLDKFVKDVVNWYKAQSFDSLKGEKESDIIKKIHKKTKENLEALGKVTKTNLHTSPRGNSAESSGLVGEIRKNLTTHGYS